MTPQPRAPRSSLPGAVLRPVLRHHAGPEVLPLRRAGRRADRGAVRGAGQGARHRHGAPDLRGGAARRLLQHRGRGRRRRHLPRQVPQAPHPEPAQVLGEVLLPPRQPRVPGVRDRRRQDRRLHLLRPALPRGLARAGPQRRADRLQPQRHQARALATGSGRSSSPAAAVANGYFVARSTTGWGSRTTSTATRRSTSTAPARSSARTATSSASAARSSEEELLVRDLDLDQVRQVRERWQFYRDRRPDSYAAIVRRLSGRTCMTTLINGGTVVSATGRMAADVLIDGETIAAVLAPGSTALGTTWRRRRPGHRRDRQVRHPRRHRRAHPHGAAVRRHDASDTFETGTRAAAWGGTTTIIDFAVQRTASGSRTGSAPGTSKAAGNCAIDYGFHQIVGGVDEDSLKAMEGLVDEGVTQLQAVHGLPGRLLHRRRPDPAGHAEGRANWAC